MSTFELSFVTCIVAGRIVCLMMELCDGRREIHMLELKWLAEWLTLGVLELLVADLFLDELGDIVGDLLESSVAFMLCKLQTPGDIALQASEDVRGDVARTSYLYMRHVDGMSAGGGGDTEGYRKDILRVENKGRWDGPSRRAWRRT